VTVVHRCQVQSPGAPQFTDHDTPEAAQKAADTARARHQNAVVYAVQLEENQ
jgi:hypothetical protein